MIRKVFLYYVECCYLILCSVGFYYLYRKIQQIKSAIMNNEKMQEIVEKSLISTSIKSISKSKYINWCDQLCALVNLIPYVGGAFATEIQSIKNSVAEYKAYEFFRKFTYFIYELEELTEAQRIEFVADIEKAANDASGNIVIGLVDRLDNINKEKVLANLVKAKVTYEISIEDFFRLSSMLERIPYVDLVKLKLYLTDYYDKDGDSELLFATGVLQQSVIDANDDNKYVLSKLGKKLLKHGLGIEVSDKQPKGTKVSNLTWNEIDGIEPIAEEKMNRVIKEYDKKKNYEESDSAMFNHDVERGK